jgi:hypothetical protein
MSGETSLGLPIGGVDPLTPTNNAHTYGGVDKVVFWWCRAFQPTEKMFHTSGVVNRAVSWCYGPLQPNNEPPFLRSDEVVCFFGV